MEDYVYTFLVRLARTEDSLGEAKTRVAVLTGNLKWRSQTAYLFIKGSIIAEEMMLSEASSQLVVMKQRDYSN